ncbi:MAG: FliA/WhiG family RNA polymerase sigma factor [candidate division Zixibacteria bacterium]|nr:FliA/WhiG family RNA polymerase sigma factor [candidate division Zixibacteria bacterium]
MVSTTKAEPKKPEKKKSKMVPVNGNGTNRIGRARKWDVSDRDWARYQKYSSPEIRQDLLNRYLPLVRNVASRMAMGFPRSVELSDLVNTGVIGLIEAFRNFDRDRGVKFETYAVPRIRGAILDELRSLDWVPRSTRAKSREIERAHNFLENKLGRPPEKNELAKHMKISVSELYGALGDVSGTSILSLDEVVFREDDNRQVPRIETVVDKSVHSVLGEIEKGELQSFLVVAIDRLTEQEKLVIALYYFEELTLKEIGECMSISESRVSQIHTRAVAKLRGMVREKFALTG